MTPSSIAISIAVFAVFALFRPIILGIMKAGVVLVSPRKSLEERIAAQENDDARYIRKLAKENEHFSPNLAQELRYIASRG